MDRRDWRATVHGIPIESDTTKHTHTPHDLNISLCICFYPFSLEKKETPLREVMCAGHWGRWNKVVETGRTAAARPIKYVMGSEPHGRL